MEAVRDGRVQLALSLSLHEELEDVLHRRKLAERMVHRGTTPADVLAAVMAVAEIVAPGALPMPLNLRDPKDLTVLAAAASAKADAIVTGDDDLLSMGSFEGIPILEVRQALGKLGIPAE